MGLCLEKVSTDFQSFFSNDDYQRIPLVSIEQAIQPLISLLPKIEIYLQLVKEKCLHPADGLTSDQSASIMLYAMLWQPFDQCLYITLNSTLQTWNQSRLQPWLFYLKLLFTALANLPSNRMTVYRGSKFNVSREYLVHQIIYWWDLSLCTSSLEYLQSDQSINRTSVRTIFIIESHSVKNIEQHCYDPCNPLRLFLPETGFQVLECNYQEKEDWYLIKLQEIAPSFLLHHSFAQIQSNGFQFRCCSLFKQSRNDRSTYRNPLLEHRIINNEHSWTLDLDRQNLTDRDMRIVVKYAMMKNHCKRIRLRDNSITSQGCSILSEGLHNNTRLESFDLRNNQISDMGVRLLSSALIYSNIKTLNLESNEISAEGASYLAQMVRDSRTLAELYLSKNHLGDRGAEYLAKALIPNTQHESSTREVSAGNRYRDGESSNLQHLYLGQNEITDLGLKHLSDMLRTNRTLTWLWLTGNEMSNDGIEYLANILADYNFTLEWLFLNSNKLINDSSIDDLIHMLKRNHSLKTLYLNNCNLSEITKRKLQQITKVKKDFDLEV